MRDKRDIGGLMRRVPLCLINEIGILLYIVAALTIPEAPEEGRVVIVGVILILKAFGIRKKTKRTIP